MVSPKSTTIRCKKCGKSYEADTLICPECRVFLVSPKKRRTPGWVYALLSLVIIALAIYIVYLARDIFVFHNY